VNKGTSTGASMDLSACPDPLVAADVELRGWFMPLYGQWLRDSDFVVLSSGDGFKAAVILWTVAWEHEPAASLPNCDKKLCRLAGYGQQMDAWLNIRDEALYGFVLCNDGRLYHEVLAAIAAESYTKKKKASIKGKHAARKRWHPDEVLGDASDHGAAHTANTSDASSNACGGAPSSGLDAPSIAPSEIGRAKGEESKEKDKDKGSELPERHPLPPNFSITPEVRAWAAPRTKRLQEHFESFVLKARKKNYQYSDWDAAFMQAILENWAKIDENGSGEKSWQDSAKGIQAKGRELGMPYDEVEPFPQYKSRVFAAVATAAH
jgi:hypothetical protein